MIRVNSKGMLWVNTISSPLNVQLREININSPGEGHMRPESCREFYTRDSVRCDVGGWRFSDMIYYEGKYMLFGKRWCGRRVGLP